MGRPDRGIGFAALLLLFVVVLAAGIAQWIDDRRVPAPFQYVVPTATVYVTTGPLEDLWRNGPAHLARVFSDAAAGNLKDWARGVKANLRTGCLEWADLSDLGRLGIDGSLGAALSIMDLKSSTVAAVPLSDPDRFIAFLERYNGVHQLSLTAAPDKPAAAIRVDLTGSTGIAACLDGRLIDPAAGATVLLDPTLAGKPKSSLTVAIARTGGGPWKLSLQCSAVYSDGTSGRCRCTTVSGGDCAANPVELGSYETKATGTGRLRVVSKPELPMRLALLDDRVAIFGSEMSLIEAAARTRDNYRFFRGDDTLIAVLTRMGSGEQGEGALAGAASADFLPVNGRVHFALRMGPNQLTVRSLIPWQTPHARFFDQLATPSPGRIRAIRPLSNDAELRVDDPAIGDYLRLIASDAEMARHLRQLGIFEAFVRDLADLKAVGPLQLAATGVRDGVPELVMAVEVPTEKARSMLLAQRIAMREKRDREILEAAAIKFLTERPEENLVKTEQLVASQHLKPEAGALWERYAIRCPRTGNGETASGTNDCLKGKPPAKWDGIFVPARALKSEDFGADNYDVLRDGRLFQYVPPRITDNDVAYRLKKDPKVDEQGLRADRFRIAAWVDEANRRLVVASDLDALAAVAANPPASESGPAGKRRPADGKLSIIGDPQFLIGQGLLHPDPEVSQYVRDRLKDLEQYRRLRLTVEPLADRRAMTATAVLSHE